MTFTKIVASLTAASLLGGCASVTTEQVNKTAEETRARITTQQMAQEAQPVRPLVERMSGTYLGSATVPLAYAATLPPIFRDKEVTLNFPARAASNGRVNLSTIAARIYEATHIPVRIQPDVFISAKSLVKTTGGNGEVAQDTNAASASAGTPGMPGFPRPPLPTPMAAGMPNGGNAAVATQMFADYDANLPMEYSGNLSGYLDFISARLGINWEYKNNGIVLFRLLTKTFPIKINPGDTKFASSLSKGGGAGGGGGASGATGGGSSSGSFTSDTSSSVDAKASLWGSITSSITGMRSPLGSSTVDQASGLVTVTDTKDAVEAIENYVNVLNSTMTRSVALEVRVLKVTTTDSSSRGFDVNLLYSKLDAAGKAESAIRVSAPGTLTTPDAGKVGFSVISPSKRWSGSEIVAQVLNDLGTIVTDETRTASTTNRTPVPIAVFHSETYLAATTPASGGATGGGQGVPGLTPGTLTTGNFLNALPTAYQDGTMLLRLSFDDTVSEGFSSASTGSGATLQQIQTPRYSGSKSDHSVPMIDGQSLVLVGRSSIRTTGSNRTGATGLSMVNTVIRDTEIIVVTPHVRAGF